MTNELDELFGVSTPKDVDTSKIAKYFKDLDRSITSAKSTSRHSDDEDFDNCIDEITNELSWLDGDLHTLIEEYNTAIETLDVYRRVVEDRLTDDEQYELNALLVRRRLEKNR